jgi:hypothetical protein
MTILGFIFIVFAGLLFAFFLSAAYDTKGGEGGAPLMAGAIFPPIFGVFGLWLVMRGHWAWWVWAVGWVGLTLMAWGAVEMVSRIAERRR